MWRILALTIPGFDPVIPIEIPLWSNAMDIFQFSQAYLLYFCLQAKLQHYFNNHTCSSMFLHAIQHSNYADTVTTLQSILQRL